MIDDHQDVTLIVAHHIYFDHSDPQVLSPHTGQVRGARLHSPILPPWIQQCQQTQHTVDEEYLHWAGSKVSEGGRERERWGEASHYNYWYLCLVETAPYWHVSNTWYCAFFFPLSFTMHSEGSCYFCKLLVLVLCLPPMPIQQSPSPAILQSPLPSNHTPLEIFFLLGINLCPLPSIPHACPYTGRLCQQWSSWPSWKPSRLGPFTKEGVHNLDLHALWPQ